MTKKVTCCLYANDAMNNRKKLFNDALECAKTGKVLFILSEELTELPELSQEHNMINRQIMQISFIYTKSLDSLVECISTLPDWKNVPVAILVDDLSQYCGRDNLQNACGVVAFLLDAIHSCQKVIDKPVNLCLSINKDAVGVEYCILLKEMYFNSDLMEE